MRHIQPKETVPAILPKHARPGIFAPPNRDS